MSWDNLSSDSVIQLPGLDFSLTKEVFGALSNDPESPLSRVSVANSSFSLDPYRGCPAGCAYCTVAGALRDIDLRITPSHDVSVKLPRKPTRLFSGIQVMEALASHPAFLPHLSIVSIGTASTEAFLPNVEEATWSILEWLCRNGLRNPVWFILKTGIPRALRATWRKRFHSAVSYGIPVVISISHSGAPVWVEPYRGDRFEWLNQVYVEGMRVTHYLRPVIPGVNDDVDSIERALEAAGNWPEAICAGGLRVDPGVLLAWSHVNGLPKELLPTSEARIKLLEARYLTNLEASLAKRGGSAPIFTHSSEMLAEILGVAEFTLRRYEPKERDAFLHVPGEVRAELSSLGGMTVESVVARVADKIGLRNIQFSRRGSSVIPTRQMARQERVALRHALGHLQLLP